MASLYNTQTVLEVLSKDVPSQKVRSTQVLVEVLSRDIAAQTVINTQTVVEVLSEYTTTTTTVTTTTGPPARVTAEFVEVLQTGDVYGRLTAEFVEVLRGSDANYSRLTAQYVEVLIQHTTTTTTTTTAPPLYVQDVVITGPTTTTTTTTTTTAYVPPTTTTTTTSTTLPFLSTTTTTTTTSTTITTTTTTTLPPICHEWGEENPWDNVTKQGWQVWSSSTGNLRTSPMWGNWGQLILYPGESAVSSVRQFPAGSKVLTVTLNKYGSSYAGYVDVYVRGSSISFNQTDVTPSWQEYTGPFASSWNYGQVKLEFSYGTSTTSSTTSTT